MNIESVPSVTKTVQPETAKLNNEPTMPVGKPVYTNPMENAETKQAIDQATGLLQTITTDKISDKVIRKMPSDEYLHLLSLLDDIMSGSIDKHV